MNAYAIKDAVFPFQPRPTRCRTGGIFAHSEAIFGLIAAPATGLLVSIAP